MDRAYVCMKRSEYPPPPPTPWGTCQHVFTEHRLIWFVCFFLQSLEHNKAGNKDLLTKADGVVIVYSIDDLHSFDVAEGVCDWLRRDRKHTCQLPLVLLGNKSDLDHRRFVQATLKLYETFVLNNQSFELIGFIPP